MKKVVKEAIAVMKPNTGIICSTSYPEEHIIRNKSMNTYKVKVTVEILKVLDELDDVEMNQAYQEVKLVDA